ncbi:MAG: hypothetical protein WC947_10770 [Elusimicrobiota bacterium]
MINLRKKGIFYLIEGEEARRLAGPLGLKLLEKKVTEPSGETKVYLSCGFPKSGMDKYIGKLVRLGENVAIVENGELVEKIEIMEKGKDE